MTKTWMLGSITLALALGGCGYLPGGGSSPSAASTTVDPADQAVKFAQCMRAHGVQMADPVDGKITIKATKGDNAKVQTAMKACQKFAPRANGGGPVTAEDLDQALKTARCLRAHGLDVPDPKVGGGMMIKTPKGKTQADIDKAMRACSAGPQKSTGNSTGADHGSTSQVG